MKLLIAFEAPAARTGQFISARPLTVVDGRFAVGEKPELFPVGAFDLGYGFAEIIAVGAELFAETRSLPLGYKVFPQVKVGERVKVPHGFGTVVGFEVFDRYGKSITPTLDQSPLSGRRVIVELEPGHSWPFKDKEYYASRSDVMPPDFKEVWQ